MTAETWLAIGGIASPIVVGGASAVIARWLAKADRDRTEQTRLIKNIDEKVTGMDTRLARVETSTGSHHDEIGRIRSVIDRWNRGPLG